MTTKVMLVGGAGFIGSNLSQKLLEEGYEVHVLDNLVGGKKEAIPQEAIFHQNDIRNCNEIAPLLEGIDTVFHLAALPRVQFSIEHPIETHETNVSGFLNVLKASKDAGVRRVVYSASSSAYGDQPVMPLVETMPANPKSPYGLQKYMGELMCKVWANVYGIETVSLRYFNVYGPGQSDEGAYALVIAKFIRQIREGKPMSIAGDGSQTRDFTSVKDVVRANILAMKSKNVGKGEVINIGAGRNQSIKRIAELIGGPIEYTAPRLEPHDTRADNSLAKALLDWSPTISIEEGIEEVKKLYL